MEIRIKDHIAMKQITGALPGVIFATFLCYTNK